MRTVRGATAGSMVEAAGIPTGASTGANIRSLRQFAWAELVLLAVQSLSGLVLNLYITLGIPPNIGAVFVLTPVLTVHILSAFLLLIGGVFLLLYGWRSGGTGLRALSLGAFLSVVVAIQEGFVFTFTQASAFSFGMELGFLGAMILCGTLLFLTSTPPEFVRSAKTSAPRDLTG
ncbi:MAG: hypothetical protein L3K14_04465 [Thermoplasmata archaeon]|nr:hypothetical protein [Thermoplasmata archaeon]